MPGRTWYQDMEMLGKACLCPGEHIELKKKGQHQTTNYVLFLQWALHHRWVVPIDRCIST